MGCHSNYFYKMLYSIILFIVTLLPQHHFATIPAGNYSGIAWLGGDRYAVVSDKEDTDGFFVWSIGIDSVTGEIQSARNEGFFSSTQPNRDGKESPIIRVPTRSLSVEKQTTTSKNMT